jgi:hypothetical protein
VYLAEKRGERVGDRPKPQHDTFERFMELERWRLQEHASGKLAEALCHALLGETQEELDRVAAEDQRMAQEGMVPLKIGEEIHHKHIYELTPEDRLARFAAERVEVAWLMERVERKRKGTDSPTI